MTDDDSTDSAGIRMFPPIVFIGGLAVGYFLHWLRPLPIVSPENAMPVRTLGVVALLLGVFLIGAAARMFRAIGEDPNPMQPTHALTFEGPYRFTRNPMYLGMSFLLAGFALLGNALWPLVALAPVIVLIRTQVIAKEEAYLERKFGGEYVAYKNRVRRWL